MFVVESEEGKCRRDSRRLQVFILDLPLSYQVQVPRRGWPYCIASSAISTPVSWDFGHCFGFARPFLGVCWVGPPAGPRTLIARPIAIDYDGHGHSATASLAFRWLPQRAGLSSSFRVLEDAIWTNGPPQHPNIEPKCTRTPETQLVSVIMVWFRFDSLLP